MNEVEIMDTKPRISQAKNFAGRWNRPQHKNWILRYGDMMLIYTSQKGAVYGLKSLVTWDMVNHYGLVGYQVESTPSTTSYREPS